MGAFDDLAHAAQKATKGSVVGDTLGGAIGGAATGASVGAAVGIGLPIASFAAGGIAAAAGASAATSLGIMGAGLAVGSAIPIPGLGTIFGLIIGALAALGQAFKGPTPEFARALLATFRQYPNTLLEFVTATGGLGITLPLTGSGVHPGRINDPIERWKYVAFLRKVAGETGPDPFDDERWRRDFEAGRVEPEPPATPPDLRVLGIHAASMGEAQNAARSLAPLLSLGPVFEATVEAVDGPHGPTVSVVVHPRLYVPEGLEPPPPPVAERPKLFVYGERIPMVSTASSPPTIVPLQPDAQVTDRAEQLRTMLAALPWVCSVAIVPRRAVARAGDGAAWGFEVHVSPSATAAQRLDAEGLASVATLAWKAGAREVIVVDDPSVAFASAPSPLATTFPPSAQVTERAERLRAAYAALPWVRGVDVVAVKSLPVPDDAAYGFAVRLSPSATAAQRFDTRTLARSVLDVLPGARQVVLVTERSAVRPLLVIGGVLSAAVLLAIAFRPPRPPPRFEAP